MTLPINCEPLKTLIRTVPDFPKPGILFYDITTVLKDKAGFATLIDAFAQYYIGKEIDLVSAKHLDTRLAFALLQWHPLRQPVRCLSALQRAGGVVECQF